MGFLGRLAAIAMNDFEHGDIEATRAALNGLAMSDGVRSMTNGMAQLRHQAADDALAVRLDTERLEEENAAELAKWWF